MARAAVVKFKDGATQEQIAKALNAIKDVLDLPLEGFESESFEEGGRKCVRYHKVPFRWSQIVHEYDPKYGEPVFYIP